MQYSQKNLKGKSLIVPETIVLPYTFNSTSVEPLSFRMHGEAVHHRCRSNEVGKPTDFTALCEALQQRGRLPLIDPQLQQILREAIHVSIRDVPAARHHTRTANRI